MAYFNFNNKNIYYEVHGKGKPLVILNGIMMSHASWGAFIPELSRDNKVILVDFLDQGKSDKMNVSYKHDLQVELVNALFNELQLDNVNLFGISYGGEIAIQFAIKYGNKLNKLLLFNTASWTNPWLKDIGKGWVDAARTNNPEFFYNVSIPIIYSPMFYTKNIEWMNSRKNILNNVFNEEFLRSMIRLIESSEGYDKRSDLKVINVNTLIVSSESDFIIPPIEQEFIHKNIKDSQLIHIKNCGHASMYEKPNEFISILKGFLVVEKSIKIV